KSPFFWRGTGLERLYLLASTFEEKAFSDLPKAIQTIGLTLKGYSDTETSRGLAWSCKVYFQNKKIGLVSNSGHGGPTVIDVPVETLDYIVNALKSNAYTLTLESARHLNEEPTDSRNWFGDAVTQMIDEVDRLRKLKRLAKTHVIVRQKSSAKETL
ncbi:hypothetical protein, partial [Pseudomonas cannabina]|uniref:hypothetical protein n=1 Tax=Pseudomonas cannabina TaxID=86840 RepID=UPI0016054244